MADLTHFDLIHLEMDPQSKAISALQPARALNAELDALNTLHRALLHVESPHGVPGPVPPNAKRSAQITKLRENGNAEYKRQNYAEAIKLYGLGIQMAATRPPWEPVQLVREEMSGLLANRAQAHMALGNWAEGGIDAETSVEARRTGNAKGWWRRGRCLVEMGRLEEARGWVKNGLEVEGEEADLVSLLKEVESLLEKRRIV